MPSSDKQPHRYPDAELAAMASWAAVRAAKTLAGTVENLAWEFPVLSGRVTENGTAFSPKIDFRSQSLPRNHCDCALGKKQQFCAHALALCFRFWAENNGTGCPAALPGKSRATPTAPARGSHAAAPVSRAGDTAPMRVEGSPQYLAITPPGRDHPNHAGAVALLRQNQFQFDPSSRVWWLRDRHRVLNFLAENGARLPADFGAQFTAGFLQRTAGLATARLAADAEEKPGGTFALALRIDAPGVADAELHTALARNQNYVETPDGKIVLLPPGLVTAAAELGKKLNDSDTAGPAPRLEREVSSGELADIESALETAAVPFTPPETWKSRSAALRNLGALTQAPCSPALQNRLRLYQQIGAAWLWHLFRNQLGGVLADEMGLGKTVQAIAFLEAVARDADGATAPALVVCPAALVENWCRELARFAPELRVHRHHGSSRPDAFDFANDAPGVVVTSYGTLTRDVALFHAQTWSVIIADEAQHIKNRRSQNARSLRQLRAAGRFVLTGTPVENSLDDLRSLFEFLMPGHLPRPGSGTDREARLWHDQRAREKAAPYILRRTKHAVAPELPEKIEQTLYCELEGEQAALYRAWQDRARAEVFELEMGGAAEGRVRLAMFNQLLRLRQICAEPRLLAPEMSAEHSAKFRALREILDEAADGGHRILLFSQFVEVLRHLRGELDALGIATCYIDGSTRDRQAECDRFNNDPAIPIFLISLKAGGVGLNLTGADTVVHYDPWWNPAAEAQATDRAHRIGQKKTVTAIRLIATGTVEERVLELQRTKAGLLRDLFAESDTANAAASLADLKDLLDAS